MKPRRESTLGRPYVDSRSGLPTVKILPGEFYATDRDYTIVTVLGSCVAACIRDRRLGSGGMNHFMLPATPVFDAHSLIPENAYGMYAMDVLIGALVKHGSLREDLEAKVFGGAAVNEGMTGTRIGELNAEFVGEYLRTEQIRLLAADMGGVYPRKIYFSPRTGVVDVRYLGSLHNTSVYAREAAYLHAIERRPVSGEIDLF